MQTRREMLSLASRYGVGLALAPFLAHVRAQAEDKKAPLPKRFVFVARWNGLLQHGIQPRGLEDLVPNADEDTRKKVDTQKVLSHALQDYALHPTMQALEPFKSKLNIIQGLSGKMCVGAHSGQFGALGAYRNEENAPPSAETLDCALAKAFPSIFPHLGLAMDRKDKLIVYPILSAFERNKPASFFADPMAAYNDLFGAVAAGGPLKTQQDLQRNLLDYMVSDIKRLNTQLTTTEKEKLGHYLDGFEALRERRAKLSQFVGGKETLPQITDKYTSAVETHRMEAHFDMAASALITGMTNVVTFHMDDLDQTYTGLELKNTVHDIGHMVLGRKGLRPDEIAFGPIARDRIRKFHFDLVAKLATKLNSVPEGNGTMLDNTLLVFFSLSGSSHHAGFSQWPMVTLGGLGGRMKTGKYLHYPDHGKPGHATIGNFYTTILHAAGIPRDGFGEMDRSLPPEINQRAPLPDLLA